MRGGCVEAPTLFAAHLAKRPGLANHQPQSRHARALYEEGATNVKEIHSIVLLWGSYAFHFSQVKKKGEVVYGGLDHARKEKGI